MMFKILPDMMFEILLENQSPGHQQRESQYHRMPIMELLK